MAYVKIQDMYDETITKVKWVYVKDFTVKQRSALSPYFL